MYRHILKILSCNQDSYRSLVGTHFNDFKESGDTARELPLGVELLNVCQNVMEVGLKPGVMGWLSKYRILQKKNNIW